MKISASVRFPWGLGVVLLLFCLDVCFGAEASVGSKPTKGSSLIVINEDEWEQLNSGEWMVEFHAPWCPACRQLQPEWKTFSSWASDLG